MLSYSRFDNGYDSADPDWDEFQIKRTIPIQTGMNSN
jgi:hypothetical protein